MMLNLPDPGYQHANQLLQIVQKARQRRFLPPETRQSSPHATTRLDAIPNDLSDIFFSFDQNADDALSLAIPGVEQYADWFQVRSCGIVTSPRADHR